ncbi:hypothetical protein GDO86_001194 [Hymenochirus boettgeri]|uniref:ADP-ribosylation factor-like protein 9 n=1 Tax=Hymenochirus boettgeri TaxID=247094 RepID=A0A8T2KKF1_9PIPI|nr:hypothetical protein GDO86_001194 [Hymenochirus boettgeri]
MSGFRGMGLAVAMLAASGGVAYVTWSYISAKRKKQEQTQELVAELDHIQLERPVSDRPTLSAVRELRQEVQHPRKQVLVLGLDGSGKTSVLNSIVTNRGSHSTAPTEGIHAVCLTNGKSRMEFLEVGGSEKLRPFWEKYLDNALALVYVVDSTDHSRLPLAKMHLHQVVQQNSMLPLVVLANKQDLQMPPPICR